MLKVMRNQGVIRRFNSTLPISRAMSFNKSYSTASSRDADDILFKNENAARIITLNRPKKLNSLSASMVDKITARLLEYRKSNLTNLVIINSSNQRAFCAGGDVAQAAKDVINHETEAALDFFHKEYSLNYLLSIYQKPVVSYLDGITMGGGVGLSVHSPFRIATENTRLAMPEMDIGFFPDVGTSFFLPRVDGQLGKFLAYTGESLQGIDNLVAGFATHYVPSIRLEELTKRLGGLNIPKNELLNAVSEEEFTDITEINEKIAEYYAIVNNAIEEFSDPIPSGHQFKYSNEQRNFIDKVFKLPTINEIFKKLAEEISNGSISEELRAFAGELYEKLSTKSFISLRLASELFKNGAKSNNKGAITQELILAQNILLNPGLNDFVEGVNKKLITKTNDPKWRATSLEDIPLEDVHKLLTDRQVKYTDLIDFTGKGKYINSYKDYPYNMGLPSEREIKNYVTGNDGSNRDYAPTRKEVLSKFTKQYRNKVGMNWKVNNVLDRKTKQHEYDAQYINWVDEE